LFQLRIHINDEFTRHFTMPATGLIRQFSEIRRVNKKFTTTDLVGLAGYYKVSVEAMTRRYEGLKLLPAGMWDDLKRRGLKVREVQAQLGLPTGQMEESMLPKRYIQLAEQAYLEEKITEGQLARFLRISRVEARRQIETHYDDASEIAADDLAIAPVKIA
jgi:Zn-dependent peptidase ImmA (M78 family)